MSLSFDATFYQAQRPDVYNAFINTAGSTGLTWAAFAQSHYNTFGRFEGSDPSASFDTSYYLSTYPDVAAAGVNPFDHFLAFGSLENRQPYSSFPTSTFVAATYAAANPDLAAAGITSDAALYQHFVLYGQFEGRSGTPAVTPPGVPGSTFTLTTGVDSPVGAEKNDTFVGSISLAAGAAAATSTFATADKLVGNNGTDQLLLTIDGEISSTGGADNFNIPGADVSGVENIFIRQLATDGTGGPGTVTFNAANAPGAGAIWSDRSTGDKLVITNIVDKGAVGLMGNNVAVLGAVDAGFATGATSANLALAGGVKAGNGTDVTLTGPGTITSLMVTSTGLANTIDEVALAGTGVKSIMVDATTDLTVGAGNSAGFTGVAADTEIKVMGAGKVNLDTLAANVKSVDASANTGGTTVVLGQAADIFTGGKGDDTATLAAGAAGPTGAVDGGEGTGDRVIITDDAQVDTAAEQGKITNFEVARLAEAGAFAFDASKIAGITKIESASTGATTISSLAATQSVSVVANGTSLSLTNPAFLAAGADKQTVTFDNSINKVATGVDLGSLTVTNADTLDVVSSGKNLTGTNSSSIGSLATGNGDLETVNITGDTAFSLTTGASTVDNVNASTFTGDLAVVATGNTAAISIMGGTGKNTLTGSGNADVVKGGAAADTITGGLAADTLSGMGGDDIFAFANFATAAGTGTIASADTAGVDNETIAVSDTADDDDETYSIVYTLNGVAGLLSGSIDDGGDVDTNVAGAVETFLAAQLNGVAGITAANVAGTVVASADGQGSLTINSVTFGGTTPPVATIADGTDTTATSTVTVDVDPVVGETYSITVTPANSTAVTASFTAATTNPQDVVNGLVAALNPLLAGKAVAGDVAGPNTTQFTITDLNPDDGGFTVSGLGVSVTSYAGDTNVSVAGTVVSGYDKITDFTGDTLRFIAADNVAGVAVTAPIAGASVQIDANGKATFAATDDTLAEKITSLAADNTNVANNEVVFFEDGGNTYVYGAGIDTTNASSDFLVELTGVTGLTKISESAATAGDFLVA